MAVSHHFVNDEVFAVQPPQLHAARRMRWLDETLKPLRKQLTAAQWRRLRAALALTMGTEAMVVMKDVCGLKDRGSTGSAPVDGEDVIAKCR
jgi:hypothetical protein